MRYEMSKDRGRGARGGLLAMVCLAEILACAVGCSPESYRAGLGATPSGAGGASGGSGNPGATPILTGGAGDTGAGTAGGGGSGADTSGGAGSGAGTSGVAGSGAGTSG
ncbi:MAG TPA: hypothetical protein VMT47_10570, partial [Polyangia bacterium]|nr:hypothetical protein [Polyangia bacterium]